MSVFDELPIEEKDGSIDERAAKEHLLQELEKHTPEQRAEYAKILTGAAAAPRETQGIETISTISAKDNERQRKWFDFGVRAHKRGYGDISPFYKNVTADYFFKCGYDGVSFVEAQQVLKEKIEQLLATSTDVQEVINTEYAK